MTVEARFYPRARLDLVEQAEYLAEVASFEIAERFLEAARQTVDHLTETPRIGRVWRGAESGALGQIRVWQVKGFPRY